MGTALMGELPSSCRESGGATPTRLVNIVLQSMGDVEEAYDWRWRRATGTVALTSAGDTFRLTNTYQDFGKILNTILIETDGYGELEVTNDVERFRAAQREWHDSSGQPELAILERDTTFTTVFGYQLRVSPTPDGSYNYSVDYLKVPAVYGLTDTPLWPPWMFRLWWLDAKWQALYAFDRKSGDWQAAKALYEAEIKRAREQLDEPEQSQLPRIHDGYGDAAAFTSSVIGLEGISFPVRRT